MTLFESAEPEEAVLLDGSADVNAPLFTVEIGLDGSKAGAGGHTGTAAIGEGAAVDIVRAPLGDDVDSAGGGEAGGDVRRRSGDLEFLNGFLGEVEGGGADMLVYGVDTVNGDACFAAGAAPNGDAGVAGLGGVEGAAFVDFDAGLEAREFEIVAAIEGQLVDLAGIDDSTDDGLLGIDGGNIATGDID